MKSRISYFDGTIFKKNLTRFAPFWGLYTVCLILMVFSAFDFSVDAVGRTLMGQAASHSIVMFFFAPLLTQLLFGDLLYNPRMCKALHALPPRRETWFFTNVVSGYAMFLIPAVTTALLTAVFLWLVDYPGTLAVAPLWLLNMLLNFTCLFGISIFVAFFAGKRAAHWVVYYLLSISPVLLGGLLEELYVTHFYGVQIDVDAFANLSPAIRFGSNLFLEIQQDSLDLTGDIYYRTTKVVDTKVILPGENFGYCFFAAALGLALILVALWLYRRRELECAGDFIAVPGIKPVFALVYTLTVAVLFHSAFAGGFLLVGLIIGWFTALMLLERTSRVFSKKNLLRGGILISVFLLTLVAAKMDILGIESWVPEAEKVTAVRIDKGHYNVEEGEELLLLTSPEDIETVIGIHEDCLENKGKDGIMLTISYKLKSGRTVNRYYFVRGEENLQHLTRWLSTPAQIFGADLTEEEFLEQNQYVTIRKDSTEDRKTVTDPVALRALYQAILLDCEEGNMASLVNRHRAMVRLYVLEFENGETVAVYANCVHTLQWIENHK